MGKLRLTPRAQANLDNIWRTIAADSPRAADNLIDRIMARGRAAADFPKIGVARPDLSPRARVLVVRPYIVIYEPQRGGILIVSVVHGMRDPEHWLD